LESEVSEILGAVEGIKKVHIDIVWEPPWNPEMITPEARKELQGGN
jgi:metal-sulfur cluster biosynthetic enzyme